MTAPLTPASRRCGAGNGAGGMPAGATLVSRRSGRGPWESGEFAPAGEGFAGGGARSHLPDDGRAAAEGQALALAPLLRLREHHGRREELVHPRLRMAAPHQARHPPSDATSVDRTDV